MTLHPDQNLKCLLIHPKFSAFSFWNYVDAAKTIGAKTPSPPLGLITLAAILPQNWEYRLLDLNAQDFSEEDWKWANIICVGGMLPQQKGILEIIKRANREKKYVAVGGSDPSSQPSIYSDADALVVGEGESAVPVWLESWRAGKPRGIFKETEKPDVSKSPCPRYDLLNLNFYVQIGVQYSRGCPFNCEFCDIIELFGRKPRTKTPQQILNELTAIKNLGYSGSIDVVDDNFIGNKRDVKRNLLPALIEWNRLHGHPFYYCTEASMNMADDIPLMELMQEADFRVIFMGIETPDPELLLMTQKSQNTVKPIVDRVQTLYKYGMVTTAGFIMGFDGEKRGMDKSMIKLIEDTSINMAMVGLLVALPNTQLTRRLLKENRLLSFTGERVTSESELRTSARDQDTVVEVVDQTVAGLNFITTRDRVEILKEYKNVVAEVYNAKKYFDRALRVGEQLVCKSKHRPRLFQLRRHLRGFIRTSWQMTKDPETRGLYWRNFFKMLSRGHTALEQVMRLMGIYLHFKKQTQFLAKAMDAQIEHQSKMPADMRMVPVVTLTAEAVEEVKDTSKSS
jgi:radical SAM superfamily enzyme YgiQ (UPF0313 family)